MTGHASIRDNQPYFITESLTGDRVDATVDDFDRVFQLRYPRLMFLSGCRTGQSSERGAVPSLAASLVEKGATAVLGWARPVSDTGAIQAATELYRSLAQGLTISEALSLTYQALIRDGVKDWCLKPELVDRYLSEFIAFEDGRVLDHDLNERNSVECRVSIAHRPFRTVRKRLQTI